MTDIWPPLSAYAITHPCPTCKAAPGQPCDAPNKNARLDRIDRNRDRMGHDPADHNPAERMHTARQDAGMRHKQRDIGKAPWPEDREPGRRYDSLGDAWQLPDA